MSRILILASAIFLGIARFRVHFGRTQDRIAKRYGCILALTGGLLIAVQALPGFAKEKKGTNPSAMRYL